MLTASSLLIALRISLAAFPEPPGIDTVGLVETVEWTAEDSLIHGRLDSLTIDLAVISADPGSSAKLILDLIKAIQESEADSGSAAAVRRDILLENARTAYARVAARMEQLPAETNPDLLMLDLGFSDTSRSSETEIGSDLNGESSESIPVLPHIVANKPLPDIPMVVNRDVENALSFFQTRGRKVMQRWFDRSAEVIPELMPYLRDEGMPDELIYLSMIESGFNYHAYSYAKAVGPWQFIKGTGKRYGLKINNWYDERRDPELSTRAAASYLRDLYYMFGDWYLAMASYNCGEGKVDRHTKKYGNNFWALDRLPKQTRGYVPTYIAARMIAEAPEIYGFWMPRALKPEPTEKIFLTQCVELAAIAACAGIEVSTLKSLNPALLRSTTPPGGDSTMIRLPKGSVLAGFWDRFGEVPAAKKSDMITHRVRRGESIGGIAASYGVPVDVITDYPENQIGRRYLIREGQTLYIPVAADKVIRPKVNTSLAEEKDASGNHVVRSGETLAGIARANRVPLEQLAEINSLTTSSTIFPGQTLKIEGHSPTELAVNKEGSSRHHIVNSGDTLWHIARTYGVTVDDLRRANGLKSKSLLKPGQRLAIPIDN